MANILNSMDIKQIITLKLNSLSNLELVKLSDFIPQEEGKTHYDCIQIIVLFEF